MTRKALSLKGLLAISAIGSFCALVYQLVIAATFISITGDSVLWQSLTAGIFLAAAGIGTFAANRVRRRDPWKTLFVVEFALAVFGVGSVVGILGLEGGWHVYETFFVAEGALSKVSALAMLSSGHLFTFAVGFFSGFEIPLVLRLCEAIGGEADRFDLVLGLNYLGALAAALGFSFVLLPQLDLFLSGAAAATLNLALCAVLAERVLGRSWLWPVGGALAAIAVLAVAWPEFHRLSTAAFYATEIEAEDAVEHDPPGVRDALRALAGRAWMVQRLRSRYQLIDLLSDPYIPSSDDLHFNAKLREKNALPPGLSVFLERQFQFYEGVEPMYHEYMAHVPVQLFSSVPRRVLILGGGDGLMARELLKYGDGVESILNVELDPAMIELAKTEPRLAALNGRSFLNPRVRVRIDDAFFFVRNRREPFDAIYIDFPHPTNYELTRLYSLEFFRNIKRLLAPGGYAVLDYPIDVLTNNEVENRQNAILMATLKATGFGTIFLYQNTQSEPIEDSEYGRDRNWSTGGRKSGQLVFNAWMEGFVALTAEPRPLNFAFRDHGVKLYALNARRLKRMKDSRFPYRDDPSLVNSIFRPKLFRPLHLEGLEYR